MSRTFSHATSNDTPAATLRRGQRNDGRPPVRRTGTRAAIIAAALAEYAADEA